MGDNSHIEWTDATWNPVHGCSVVSPGCEHCYAATLSNRFGYTKKPWTGNNAAENVQLHPERLDQPLRWKKPRRIFVNSMSDLFHELVPFEFVARVWDTMFDCGAVDIGPQHTFQILTKRPDRMLAFTQWMNETQHRATAYRNVWLGVSVEDQRRADERIPLLLQTPAAVRFLSCEPLLGPVHLDPLWLGMNENDGPDYLSWVIVGGESGPGARPMDIAWARSLVEQCKAAGAPCFVKQMGARPFERMALHHWDGSPAGYRDDALFLRDRKGGDINEWPDDLRVREFPVSQ